MTRSSPVNGLTNKPEEKFLTFFNILARRGTLLLLLASITFVTSVARGPIPCTELYKEGWRERALRNPGNHTVLVTVPNPAKFTHSES